MEFEERQWPLHPAAAKARKVKEKAQKTFDPKKVQKHRKAKCEGNVHYWSLVY